MLKKWQWAVVGVLALFAVGLVVVGYRVSVKAAALVPPPPTALAVWLPAGAEIRTTDEVRPGTFSVTLPLDEFKRRFPTGGIVTYPPGMATKPDGGTEPITVWYAESGSAVFYKTVQPTSSPQWPRQFQIKTLRLENGSIVAHPVRVADASALALYFLSFLCWLGGAAVVFCPLLLRRGPDNSVVLVRPT